MPLHLCQFGNKTMSPGINHRCCSLQSPGGKAINRHGPVGTKHISLLEKISKSRMIGFSRVYSLKWDFFMFVNKISPASVLFHLLTNKICWPFVDLLDTFRKWDWSHQNMEINHGFWTWTLHDEISDWWAVKFIGKNTVWFAFAIDLKKRAATCFEKNRWREGWLTQLHY